MNVVVTHKKSEALLLSSSLRVTAAVVIPDSKSKTPENDDSLKSSAILAQPTLGGRCRVSYEKP